ncbi:ParB domain-containing protein [Ruminococcaceae bacterium BL-6]|nr:ParB domain-containing protein [Ruminococcaceae bacterium BL-6]
MQEINVNELRPHPKNDYFFDDMEGQKWTEFLESVKTSGIIEPIVVTQDKVIVSGHQRVRACKELRIQKILTEIRIYDSEDQVIKDLIETNIRQRGDISSSSLKMGRIICELERIYNVKSGRPEKTSDIVGNKNQEDIAKELGMSVDSLNNYKKLTTLIPELQDMVDTGSLTTSVASRILARLSPTDQKNLILTYGKDEIENATQAKTQQMIDEMQRLKNVNAGLQMKIDSKQKEVADAVAHTTERLSKQINQLNSEKSILERKVKLNQNESDKYKKLKSDIEFLTKQKTDLSRQIESATELAGLTVRLQHTLENDLAPIKYKRCMEVLDSNDTAIKNLSDVIDSVDKWLTEIKKYLPNKNVINTNYKEI